MMMKHEMGRLDKGALHIIFLVGGENLILIY